MALTASLLDQPVERSRHEAQMRDGSRVDQRVDPIGVEGALEDQARSVLGAPMNHRKPADMEQRKAEQPLLLGRRAEVRSRGTRARAEISVGQHDQRRSPAGARSEQRSKRQLIGRGLERLILSRDDHRKRLRRRNARVVGKNQRRFGGSHQRNQLDRRQPCIERHERHPQLGAREKQRDGLGPIR